ncbi:hypothetical protein F0562_010418 [Nyssa sinensis]|uniref:Magnesium transporter CorA-like family protein n=1 Tax=Nyssa sinensis TaxID=561372 RepID=A0A5J5A3X8_9ASTE|nr:hypothetical protein F0562_010418 [Nyssa sinensis]
MKCNISNMGDEDLASSNNNMEKQENKKHQLSTDVMKGGDLWTHGLICAFEFVRGHRKTIGSKSGSKIQSVQQVVTDVPKKQVSICGSTDSLTEKVNNNNFMESVLVTELESSVIDTLDDHICNKDYHSACFRARRRSPGDFWIPIGWTRISELVQMVQVDASWASQSIDFTDDEDDVTRVNAWLRTAQWLHPAISVALRDESRLISERMKHLLYEVPVRVAGGLLFELLGQSAGDPFVDEDDIPVVLRSWQAQNFLVTALHIKGSASNINVLGIAEVQELLAAGGGNLPRTIHEVIALLACHLARWDDRLFRKSIFGAADEVELKFMNRRTHEDMHLFSILLNQEITRLSTQVIRVKWSLHAREEIVFELHQHLRGNATRSLLEGIRKSTREMIEEQEAVRGRLFTIQDVMQSTVRAWLQDKSLRITHNLGVFGGCGLVLSIVTGLFGINVDGIPGAEQSPYAFALFSGILLLLGVVLIAIGLLYLGLKNPVIEEQVEVRKLELEELVKMFQQEAESHAQVRKPA